MKPRTHAGRLVNDVLLSIRGSIGDLQNSRWKDEDIFRELNVAIDRSFSVLVRMGSDLAQGRAVIELQEGQAEFALPDNFGGVVNLYLDHVPLELIRPDEFETMKIPSAVWTVDGMVGRIGSPSKDGELSLVLRYWARPDRIDQPADKMPWQSLFDAVLEDYARLRLLNADEFTIQQDESLLAELESHIRLIVASRAPMRIKSRGWL